MNNVYYTGNFQVMPNISATTRLILTTFGTYTFLWHPYVTVLNERKWITTTTASHMTLFSAPIDSTKEM